MITQTVVWTVLPDPAAPASSSGLTQLSLLASPRLSNDEGTDGGPLQLPLSRYRDLADWPDVQLEVAIEIAGPAGAVSVPAAFVDEAPDLTMWRAIFPPDLAVAPFQFDRTPADTPILSYPAKPVADSLATAYSQQFGRRVPSLGSDAERLGINRPAWEAVDRLVRAVGAAVPSPAGRPVSMATGQAMRDGSAPDGLAADPAGWLRLSDFHRSGRLENRGENASGPRSLREASTRREFHRVFATLADHPAILARLGLVRRLRLSLPAAPSGPVTIRAVLSHGQGLVDYRPRTRCVISAGRLRLATADGTEASPCLPLDDTASFSAITVDTDGSGLPLQSHVARLARSPRDRPPPPVGLPALRSDGIFVAEADRQVRLKETLRRAADEVNADLAAGGDGSRVTIEPDELQHGYRVDVLDQASQRWYPLCRRVGTYSITGAAPLPIDDEGAVSEVLIHGSSGVRPANLVHQSLFRWNGWSLVAPPPGGMLDLDEAVVDPVPAADPDLPFTAVVTAAPGTLPALRYGRDYRFRARLVDVAGRSLPFDPDPAAATPATPFLRYRRFEPVLAPVLVPRRAVTYGESATVLVVRTDNSDPGQPRSGPPCERHLLAPKAAVLTLERHGVLDVPGQNRPDPDAYTLLFQRDGGVVAGTPDPGASGAPFVDTGTMELPWLPDPLARGITLVGLPDAQELMAAWPPGGAWHQRPPVRLILEPGRASGAQPARTDADGRAVRVTLPPGTSTQVLLSSHLNPGDEEVMGAWSWLVEFGGRTDDEIAALRGDAVAGRVPQLCPDRELRLVHAVRCPQEPPAFGRLQAIREPGQTYYELADDALTMHRDSTQSVHVSASWTGSLDHPGQPPQISRADLVQDEAPDPEGFRVRHDIGDTRHHVVQCTPVATSRFAAFFTERRRVRLTGLEAAAVAPAFVPGSVVVRTVVPAPQGPSQPVEQAIAYSLDLDIAVDHQAGTVAGRPGGAVPEGAEVEVAFVVPPVTRAGPTVPISVPASARPAPPVVRSAVPAFAWSRERDGMTIISTRRGGILRVFLERPWFDSGEGELLAVLVLDQSTPLELASTANADPVFDNRALNTLLERSQFPRATADPLVAVPGVHHPQPAVPPAPSPRVRAMGHPVEFDPVRGLWFSDVEILTAGHQPFVHLKLARLQPTAVRDLNLSPMVDAGFHQLPADRTLTVDIDGTRALVAVVGPAPSSRSTELTAAVQAGPPPGGDPALWEDVDQLPLTTLSPTGEGDGVWTGTVALPAPHGTIPMRMLVREHQVLPGEPQGATVLPSHPRSEVSVKRLCYFDVLEL